MQDGIMVALGIEFLGKRQAMGRTEVDAEGTSLADFRSNENRPLSSPLNRGRIAHAFRPLSFWPRVRTLSQLELGLSNKKELGSPHLIGGRFLCWNVRGHFS